MDKLKNFERIENLVKALRQCGYDVDVWWDAEWGCTDYKTHYGIEVTVNDICDGDGEPYSFIFNRNGKRLKTCLEGELKP